MSDKYKCRVTANRLVMEVLDEEGNPVVVTKKDTFGQSYQETAEVQYRKGDIIFLPEHAIKPRLSSLEMVLEPVKVAPVRGESGPQDTPDTPDTPDTSNTESTKEKGEVTVSDLIPKKKDKTTPGKGK